MKKIFVRSGVAALILVVVLLPVMIMAFQQASELKAVIREIKQKRVELLERIENDYGIDLNEAETADYVILTLEHPMAEMHMARFSEFLSGKYRERYGFGGKKGTLQNAWRDFVISSVINRASYTVYAVLKWTFYNIPVAIVKNTQLFLAGEDGYNLVYGDFDASGNISAKPPMGDFWDPKVDTTQSFWEVILFGIMIPVSVFFVLPPLVSAGVKKVKKRK